MVCWFRSLVVGPRGMIVGKHMSCSRSSMLVFVRVYLRAQIGVTLAFRVKVLCGYSLSRFVSIVFCDHVPTHNELVFIAATNQPAIEAVGVEGWR